MQKEKPWQDCLSWKMTQEEEPLCFGCKWKRWLDSQILQENNGWTAKYCKKTMAGEPKIARIPWTQVYGIIGDLDWFAETFGWPRANANHPCGLCNCDMRGEIPFNDFRSVAKWRDTCFSPDEMAAKYHHKLFSVPGLHPCAIYLDTLHTLDLGVSCHVAGNILWEIMEDHLEGSRREQRLQTLNSMVAEEYNALQIPASQRIGLLKKTSIAESSGEYPVLKHIKGRRVRHFVPVVHRLAKKYSATNYGKHRLKVAEALKEIYDLLDVPVFHMGPEMLRAFKECVDKLLLHYGHLARNKQLRYSMVQKTHKLAHLPEMAKDVSPKCCQCYAAESFMGLMVGIAKSTVAGSAPHTAAGNITMKYRMSMHLLLQGLMVLDWWQRPAMQAVPEKVQIHIFHIAFNGWTAKHPKKWLDSQAFRMAGQPIETNGWTAKLWWLTILAGHQQMAGQPSIQDGWAETDGWNPNYDGWTATIWLDMQAHKQMAGQPNLKGWLDSQT